MKKVCSLTLALCCLLSAVVMAASAEAAQSGTTKLTTTVPAASYVMHIPADQTVAFGATSTKIGNVTVTDATGFAEGKNVEVTVTHDDFHSDSVGTTIPYDLVATGSTVEYGTVGKLAFKGKADGTVNEETYITYGKATGYMKNLVISMTSTAWGKALAGEYTSTITFTSAVVVEK